MGMHSGRGARFIAAAVVLLAAATSAFAQASAPPPVNGTISAIRGTILTLALADGSAKQVTVQSATLILERDAVGVADLKAGDAMGVAARRDGTALIATNINIFAPQMWDVVRKGQWLMTDGQTMTNALVTDYAQSMSGHTLIMKYKEGTATITVPDGVPVHRLVAVKLAALAVGQQISVRGADATDGSLKAASISFDGPAKS